MHQKAFALRTAVQPTVQEYVALTFANMSRVFQFQGKLQKVEEFYNKRDCHIRSNTRRHRLQIGPFLPQPRKRLFSSRQHVKAAQVHDRALKIRSATLGDVNDTAASMSMHACCQGDGVLEKARYMFSQMQKLTPVISGPF
jgi:hypothetical protein